MDNGRDTGACVDGSQLVTGDDPPTQRLTRVPPPPPRAGSAEATQAPADTATDLEVAPAQ